MPTITTPLSAGAIDYDANCYVSFAETNTYFDSRLSGIWWGQQEAEYRQMALIEATSAIEHLLQGQDADKYDAVTTDARPKGQPLQFPRSWDRNASGTLVIDPDLKEATYLLALHLLKLEFGAAGAVDGETIERMGLGNLGHDGISASRARISWSTWPLDVRHLIEPFWKRSAKTTEGPAEQPRWTRNWVAQ